MVPAPSGSTDKITANRYHRYAMYFNFTPESRMHRAQSTSTYSTSVGKPCNEWIRLKRFFLRNSMNFETSAWRGEGLAAVVSMNRGGRARVVGLGMPSPPDHSHSRRGAAKTQRRMGDRGGGYSFVAPRVPRSYCGGRWRVSMFRTRSSRAANADPHVVGGELGGVEACGRPLAWP